MVVSPGYLMKLPTHTQRVRQNLCFNTSWPDPIVYPLMCVYKQELSCALAVPKWLSVSSGCTLALLRKVSSFHGSLFPHVTVSCARWLNMLLTTMHVMFVLYGVLKFMLPVCHLCHSWAVRTWLLNSHRCWTGKCQLCNPSFIFALNRRYYLLWRSCWWADMLVMGCFCINQLIV